MEGLLTFEQIFVRLEEIGYPDHARCMRLGVKRDPNYSLEFANQRLAELERKKFLTENKKERLSPVTDDPSIFKDIHSLQEHIDHRDFKDIKIKNKVVELFTENELSAFLTYWNGMVHEANNNRKYFAEAYKLGDFGPIYCVIKFALLARHRSRKLNNWKRYRKEYHQEAEKEFLAFVIKGTSKEYLAEKERKRKAAAEKQRKLRVDALRSKVQDYYSKKIPLFFDQVISNREQEFDYKYGINSYKRITF